MRFRNRVHAGKALAEALLRYKSLNPVIMALPRGGVPVAAEVAQALKAPLGIILVRKIGAPKQPELALGAVVDGSEPVVVRNPDILAWTGTSEAQFQRLCSQELAEIERRRDAFLGKRAPIKVDGRVVIVIDDGIATGATMRVALRAMRMHNPKRLILAAPVASKAALSELRELADDIVALTNLEPVGAVGYFYDDFEQLSDDDVTAILARVSTPQPALVSQIDAAFVRRLVGDIDDITVADILRLKPSIADIEDAVRWAAGNGDITEGGPALQGKAAAIYDILAADENEEREGVA
jgi:predicted phosphoribosyltransferase